MPPAEVRGRLVKENHFGGAARARASRAPPFPPRRPRRRADPGRRAPRQARLPRPGGAGDPEHLSERDLEGDLGQPRNGSQTPNDEHSSIVEGPTPPRGDPALGDTVTETVVADPAAATARDRGIGRRDPHLPDTRSGGIEMDEDEQSPPGAVPFDDQARKADEAERGPAAGEYLILPESPIPFRRDPDVPHGRRQRRIETTARRPERPAVFEAAPFPHQAHFFLRSARRFHQRESIGPGSSGIFARFGSARTCFGFGSSRHMRRKPKKSAPAPSPTVPQKSGRRSS